MTRLEIGMLGRFVVRRDGTPIRLGSQRTEALFGYLVMTGRPQSREHLVDLLWEDHRSSTAPGNLRVLLTNLRKSVGDFMEITRTSAGFLAPAEATWELDVHVLEQRSEHDLRQRPECVTPEGRRRLRTAVEVCRGDFLEGFDLPSGPRYDDWVRSQRDRLGTLRRAVLSHLCRAELAAGIVPDALRHAHEMVSLAPLSEDAHQLVIRALVQAGDVDGAAHQFEVLERTLDHELGTAPDPATRALFLGAPARTGPQAPAVLLRPRPADAVERRPWTALARRPREEGIILEAAEDARNGRGGIVVVHGVPGSGKSALVRGVLKRLLEEDSDWVAVGAASTGILPAEDSDLFPVDVAMQLAGDTSGSWLGGPMPMLVAERIRLHTRERSARGEAWEQRPQSAVLGRLRALAAAHPVVLVLENLQWASPATVGLLLELASDVRRRRLLLITTLRPWHRSGHPADLAALLLPRLRRTADATVLEMELEGSARSGFVRALAGVERHQLPDDLLVELERLSAGHPVMVVELLRDLVRRGVVQAGPAGLHLAGLPQWPQLPSRIGVLVDEWVSGLSPDAGLVLRSSAALEVIEAEHVAVLAGMAPGLVRAVLGQELSARFRLLVGDGPGRYRFRHPLVREHLSGGREAPRPRAGNGAVTWPVTGPGARRP